MKNPCCDCDKRHLGCHGKCEDYQAYKQERELIAERRRQDLLFTRAKYTMAKTKEVRETVRRKK